MEGEGTYILESCPKEPPPSHAVPDIHVPTVAEYTSMPG